MKDWITEKPDSRLRVRMNRTEIETSSQIIIYSLQIIDKINLYNLKLELCTALRCIEIEHVVFTVIIRDVTLLNLNTLSKRPKNIVKS